MGSEWTCQILKFRIPVYLHSFKLQFTIDGTGNKILNVFHRELTIVKPRTKVIPGRLLFLEVSPKNVVRIGDDGSWTVEVL